MENRVQIRRGDGPPGFGDLYEYELGYDRISKALYIRNEDGIEIVNSNVIQEIIADSHENGKNYVRAFIGDNWTINENATIEDYNTLVHRGETGVTLDDKSYLTIRFDIGDTYVLSGYVKGTPNLVIELRSLDGSEPRIWTYNVVGDNYEYITEVFEIPAPGDYQLTLGGNGTETEGLYFKKLQIERGEIPSPWRPAPEDAADLAIDALIRLNAVEIKTTPEAITTTVRSSPLYAGDLDKKANSDEIVSIINQTAETIKIQANKIDLVGAVTVLSDIAGNLGTITAGALEGEKVKFDLTNGTMLIGNSTEDYVLLFDGHSLKLNLGGKLLDERLDEIEESIEDIELTPGPQGPPGADGRGIVSTVVEYQVGTSGTTEPTGSWSSTVPSVDEGKYLWTRTTIKYTSGSDTITYSVAKQGEKGSQGQPGEKGADGVPTYLHVAYATDANGGGFSTTDPTGKSYLGTYTDTNEADSENWQDYKWVLIKGADGATGQEGPAGVGISSSTVTYAKSSSGTTSPTSGWSSTVPSANAGEFIWTRTVIEFSDGATQTIYSVGKIGDKGEKGDKGDQGPQGVPGKDGKDGSPTYTWIRYADDANGNGISNDPTGKLYIGFAYNKLTPTESTNPSDYKWSLIKGEKGDQGVAGPKGADGQTTYTWIKYSDNADGTGLYDTPKSTTKYIGIATNKTSINESNDKSDYTWSLFKGEKGDKGDKGDQGPQGIQGPPGNDGQSQYVHIRYSANSNGSGMTTNPSSATKYVGIAVTNSSTAPPYTGFTWSKYVGEDGSQGPQGIQGPKGDDGQPTYTWIRYADTPTSGMSNFPDGKKYIGMAFNKTTETESNNYSDYQWSLMPQNIEIGGRNLLKGTSFSGVLDSSYWWGQQGYTVSIDDTEVYKNFNSLRVDATAVGEAGSVRLNFKSLIEPELNTEYVFSFYAKALEDTTLTARWGYGSGSSSVNITTDWQKYEMIVKTGSSSFMQILPYYDKITSLWIALPKLEKGNTATDWTPAPEDADEAISTVDTKYSNKVAEINTTIDSITQRVESTESNITTINGTVAAHDIRIESAESKITPNAIVQTVRQSEEYLEDLGDVETAAKAYAELKAQEEVENLEIGTRNLFSLQNVESYAPYNTSPTVEGTTITTTIVRADPGTNLTIRDHLQQYRIIDQVYTVSGYITKNSEPIDISFFSARVIHNQWQQISLTVDPATGYFVSVARYLETANTYLFHCRTNAVAGDVIEIDKLTVVKGNKATDWTPAPEDVDEAISTVDTKYSNKVAEINTTIDSITQRVESTESDITTINGIVAAHNTRLESAESKITPNAIVNTVRSSTAYTNDLSGKVDTTQFESYRLQTAQLIEDRVEKDGVIAAISLSPETAKIQANKIKLEGLVTANSNFKILTDGSIEAKNATITGEVIAERGQIGNWIISPDSNGTLRATGSDGSLFYISPPDSIYGYLLYVRDSTGAEKVRITKEGALLARGAEITGTITGGTVRTSSGGDRIQLSDNMLRSYSSGIERVRLTTTALNFYNSDGAPEGYITATYDDLVISADSRIVCFQNTIVDGWLRPFGNGFYDIGSADYRWSRIYLDNNPNVSSDIRTKSSIQNIPNELLAELKEIKPKMYQQGEKWHFGYIAQDVERALYKYALKKVGWEKARDYVKEFELLYKDESYLSLIYAEIAVLKEAEMQARIDELEARLLALEQSS